MRIDSAVKFHIDVKQAGKKLLPGRPGSLLSIQFRDFTIYIK